MKKLKQLLNEATLQEMPTQRNSGMQRRPSFGTIKHAKNTSKRMTPETFEELMQDTAYDISQDYSNNSDHAVIKAAKILAADPQVSNYLTKKNYSSLSSMEHFLADELEKYV